MSECWLEVNCDGTACDGCGRKVPRGEPYMSGFGCERALCASCVTAGAALLAQASLNLSMATQEDASHAAG